MSKKICSVCSNKAGMLGFNIANGQRICSTCYSACSPHMRTSVTDTWMVEEVRSAVKIAAETQNDTQSGTQGRSGELIIVSTDFITDKNLQTISVVSGSRFVLSGVIAERDINLAITSMRVSAQRLGADAIIGFRYAPSGNHAYVWGTAVKYV